ncbi:MAG: hypothetical protein ACRC8Z_14130 [Empedobacter falsenii]
MRIRKIKNDISRSTLNGTKMLFRNSKSFTSPDKVTFFCFDRDYLEIGKNIDLQYTKTYYNV